mgnify:CR=1 FL=1
MRAADSARTDARRGLRRGLLALSLEFVRQFQRRREGRRRRVAAPRRHDRVVGRRRQRGQIALRDDALLQQALPKPWLGALHPAELVAQCGPAAVRVVRPAEEFELAPAGHEALEQVVPTRRVPAVISQPRRDAMSTVISAHISSGLRDVSRTSEQITCPRERGLVFGKVAGHGAR